MGTRAVVGPFSLDLDDPLDKRIAELFGNVSGRRKTATFREIMRAYFVTVDTPKSEQSESVADLTKLVRKLLAHFDNGYRVTIGDLDSYMSKNPDDPLVAEAESALDSLGGL